MVFPQKQDKYEDPVVFTAADMLEHRRRLGTGPAFDAPEAVILCYHAGLVRHVVRHHQGRKEGGFFGELHILRRTGNRVGIASGFGVGAPVVAVLVEEMVAFGVRSFVSVGVAGGLQPGLRPGDLVVADRAIRDEGTSHHYLPGGKYALASAALTQSLCERLSDAGHEYQLGTSWSIDAPYRETRAEALGHQEEGVLTVEMESAALFAVAAHLGVEAAAAFAIGDSLAGGEWKMAGDAERYERRLYSLFRAAVSAATG